MKQKRLLTSVSKQYFFFAFVAPLSLLIMALVVSLLNYDNIKNNKLHQYWYDADIITTTLSENLQYSENILTFLGNHIKFNQSTNEEIKTLLEQQTHQNALMNAKTIWEKIEFIPMGTRTKNKNQEYASTKNNPEKNIIIPPKQHNSTIQIIRGIKHKNTFIGTLKLHISPNDIANRIEESIQHSSANFIIFDQHGNLISKSPNITTHYLTNTLAPIVNRLERSERDAGKIKKPIEIQENSYHFYRNIYPYKYILLVGENTLLAQKEFSDKIYPQIIQTIVIACFLLLLLFFFQKATIKPLVLLSKTADKIANKQPNISFPRGSSHEVNNLIAALINVRRSFNREQRLKQQLEIASTNAERANKAKSQFLANMSHELRTPLGAIIGFSELMKLQRHGKLNEDQLNFLDIIHNSGKHLLEIINDILNLTKIEAGKMELKEDPIDPIKTIETCIRYVKESATNHKLTIKLEQEDNLPNLLADEIKLKQILLNLLSNAIKFTEDGGKITINIANQNGIQITVSDTGIGIPEEDLNTIMDEYGQAGNAYTRRNQQGTGLGISIVRKFADLHQAQFIIKSTIGKGTNATIHFPVERNRKKEPVEGNT